ncbi:probable Histone-lysine N-methyltransferase ATXR5 [Cynara cardunculus var. scolymus]|uniref:probable Histone-lysine N-methyltransferase ATXR5 n=1 Tax=Cynara cardunculus var. scolymus TaxID=59895 RepID=UPI000D6259F6|nr:probable Histone-lysine N-methyltransferase ATXR5 [Cynara cardunculus var. scolymus]
MVEDLLKLSSPIPKPKPKPWSETTWFFGRWFIASTLTAHVSTSNDLLPCQMLTLPTPTPTSTSLVIYPSFLALVRQISPSKSLHRSRINPPAIPKMPKFSLNLSAMAGHRPPMALAAHRIQSSPRKRRQQKYRSMKDIMKTAKHVVLVNDDDDDDDYSDAVCVICGSGHDDHQILLCDKCDKAYHMHCLRPIVARVPFGHWYCPTCSDHPPALTSFSQTKIFDFFSIKKCSGSTMKRISPQDPRKRKKRTGPSVHQKRKRRLLPYVPSVDPDCRLQQMQSLAYALTSLNLEFSDDLTYPPGMAPRSANQAILEHGGMQVLSKEDFETLEKCRAMAKRGEYPPLLIVYNSCLGYTVEADDLIKDLTLIAEYAGEVDYIRNREDDDGDSMMSLLLATDPDISLVICPDRRANIARFVSGVNNHKAESRKRQNVKCVRYNVGGECRVLLVATRDILKGEILYYDYNGYENEYPTHNFI